MQIHEMIFDRLVSDETLAGLLAQYNNRSAIFYQRPPTADDPKWNAVLVDEEENSIAVQYPRINYVVDLQENPARNTSGVLTINVWCDTQYGGEPEPIELRLRELLHTAFAQTDEYPYCLAWFRSDAFEIKSQSDETVRTYGVTVMFDLMACPTQYTLYPDPIKGMNEWTKTILPNAIVLGIDTISGWLIPTKATPVIYWRMTAQGKARQHFAYTWLDIAIEGHVYCKEAADRLYNLVQLNTAHALTGHITLEDTSPLFLKTFQIQPHMNYITTGQIKASGYFGLLQPPSHFSIDATGEPLNHIEHDYRFRGDE